MHGTIRRWLHPLLILLAAGSAGADDLPELRTSGVLRVLAVDGSPVLLRVSVVETPGWGSLLPWLLEGSGDVLAGGVTATPARARQIAFTSEVMPTRQVLVTRRPTRVLATLGGIEDALGYQAEDPEIQVGGFVGPPGSLAFGVRQDAPRREQALDEYVANLRRTPTWSRLVVKYFGERAPELLKRARGE